MQTDRFECSAQTGRHRSDRARMKCPVHGMGFGQVQVQQRRLATMAADAAVLVASDPDLHPDVAYVFAKDSRVTVRRAAAANPRLEASALDVLAGQDDAVVTSAVAGNASTDEMLMWALIHHDDFAVRSAAAKNPALSRANAESLARDSAPQVRVALARNVSVPASIAQTLAQDESVVVRESLARCTPVSQVQVVLSTDSEARVKTILARDNPELDIEAMLAIARDQEWSVRMALFQRKGGLPGQVLEELSAGDSPEWVRSTAERSILSWMSSVLGVDESNRGAQAMLRGGAWWELSRESPEVVLALAVHRNP